MQQRREHVDRGRNDLATIRQDRGPDFRPPALDLGCVRRATAGGLSLTRTTKPERGIIDPDSDKPEKALSPFAYVTAGIHPASIHESRTPFFLDRTRSYHRK